MRRRLGFLVYTLLPLVMSIPAKRKIDERSVCRQVKADIVMLLDASGSVGSSNFQKLKDFTSSVANGFTISPSNVHMSVVTFSSTVHNQFDLNTYQSSSSLQDAILRIPYQTGGTNTDKAIDYVIKNSFTSNAGDRPDAPNIAVVITDGRSSNQAATLHEAQLLHKAGIKTVSIGIGSGINVQELDGIASNNSFRFLIPNFDALHTIQGLVDNTLCQGNFILTTASRASTAIPTPALIVPGTCENKLPNCYQYGVQSCQTYRQWASGNCPKYCQFCK